MTDITCLHCHSVRVHRSRRRHPAERVLTFLGGTLRRCHDCNFRYVRFGGSLIRLTDLRRISERFLLALTMAVAVAMILVAIVWLNRSQATPADDTGRLEVPARPATSPDIRYASGRMPKKGRKTLATDGQGWTRIENKTLIRAHCVHPSPIAYFSASC